MLYLMKMVREDQLNGDGVRVTLFFSGCSHRCKGCHNPTTWKYGTGKAFDALKQAEFVTELAKDFVSGVTFTGGDPLYEDNRADIIRMAKLIKENFPEKTIWVYTGYTFNQIMADETMKGILDYADVLVDGRFKLEKADIDYPWAGSTNQRVIDVKASLNEGKVVLHREKTIGRR